MFRSVLIALVLSGCGLPQDLPTDQASPPERAVAHGLGDYAPGHEANGMAECVGEFRICRREGVVPNRECAHTFRDCVQALERPEDTDDMDDSDDDVDDSDDMDDTDDEMEEPVEPPAEEEPVEPPAEEEPPAE